jgi:hypothetical protein
MKNTTNNFDLIKLLCVAILLTGGSSYCQTTTVKYYDRYGMPAGQAKIEPESNPFKPNYIPQLPSYEPTVPIDLLVKVSQYKQHQYDMYNAAVRRSVNQLLSAYSSYNFYPPISNGWHRVYLTDGNAQICYTECRVKDMKVISVRTCEDYRLKPIISQGEEMEEYEILTNPRITNAKATVVIDNTKEPEYQTVYFMDDIAAANK